MLWFNSMQKSELEIDGSKFVSYANLSLGSIAILKDLGIDIPRSCVLN